MAAFVPTVALGASTLRGAAVSRRAPAAARAAGVRMEVAEVEVYYPKVQRHEGTFWCAPLG